MWVPGALQTILMSYGRLVISGNVIKVIMVRTEQTAVIFFTVCAAYILAHILMDR